MSPTSTRPHPAPAASRYGDEFVLTLFTDDAELAARADAAGVDRIGPDLERLGKAERQGALRGTHRISIHDPASLARLRAVIRQGSLFARANRLNDGSRDEVEMLVAAGVDVVMLPSFASADEVRRFLGLVGGRMRVVPLVETASAAADLDALLALPEVEELHVGLNDLRISLGGDGTGRFDLIVTDYVEELAARIRASGRGLGIAGLARVGDESLPIPADLVYWQLPRLGATGSLLARSFFREADDDLAEALAACRARLDEVASAGREAQQVARRRLAWHLSNVASP